MIMSDGNKWGIHEEKVDKNRSRRNMFEWKDKFALSEMVEDLCFKAERMNGELRSDGSFPDKISWKDNWIRFKEEPSISLNNFSKKWIRKNNL